MVSSKPFALALCLLFFAVGSIAQSADSSKYALIDLSGDSSVGLLEQVGSETLAEFTYAQHQFRIVKIADDQVPIPNHLPPTFIGLGSEPRSIAIPLAREDLEVEARDEADLVAASLESSSSSYFRVPSPAIAAFALSRGWNTSDAEPGRGFELGQSFFLSVNEELVGFTREG